MKRQISTDRQPWVRTAIYSFMTLTVTVIVALLMLVVLGYQFNNKDGKLEQGGLLQFESIPTGAAVTLDNLRLGSLTNTKSTVDAGNHFVKYTLTGYRQWQKSIDVRAGQIGWLSYARLIPTDIKSETLHEYDTLTGAVASPSHRYMLLHEAIDSSSFTLADIQGDTLRYATLNLPTTVFTPTATGKAQYFTIDSWSNDDNTVLIRHAYDDGSKTEWILLNRASPEKSININTAYGISPLSVKFAGGGDNLLFVQTDDTVRRINLDEQTLSRPLASKVARFSIFDEKTIIYATVPDDKGSLSVAYAAVDIASPVTLGTYTDDKKPVFTTMMSYFGKRYVAIVHGQTLTVTYGTLPTLTDKGSMKPFATQAITGNTYELVASSNNRFFVTQQLRGFSTYDIELKKSDTTTWAGPQPDSHFDENLAEVQVRPLQWLDDYSLRSDAGNMLRFYDFDGANQQDIMPVAQGFDATLSQNNKYLYAIAKTDNGFTLERARMILK